MFLTIHGSTAKLEQAVTNADLGTMAVKVDTDRRQIEVRVPHAAWDPTGKTVRLAAGVGLWDNANDKYLIPQQNADATHPGGAGNLPAPSAFFNVAFRTSEPTPAPNDPMNTASPAWWRDRAQGSALQSGSLGTLFANVDFNKLAAGTNDDSGVPDHPAPWTGSCRATSRPSRASTTRSCAPTRRSARASTAAASSRTRSTSRRRRRRPRATG